MNGLVVVLTAGGIRDASIIWRCSSTAALLPKRVWLLAAVLQQTVPIRAFRKVIAKAPKLSCAASGARTHLDSLQVALDEEVSGSCCARRAAGSGGSLWMLALLTVVMLYFIWFSFEKNLK